MFSDLFGHGSSITLLLHLNLQFLSLHWVSKSKFLFVGSNHGFRFGSSLLLDMFWI